MGGFLPELSTGILRCVRLPCILQHISLTIHVPVATLAQVLELFNINDHRFALVDHEGSKGWA